MVAGIERRYLRAKTVVPGIWLGEELREKERKILW